MRELIINGRRIADDTDAWVCAELGANHQGSVQTCRDLIKAAADAGVDAVKLQKRDLATWEARDPEAWHHPYESENSFGATYGEHRAALEFDFMQYAELKAYAESLGLVFFATAWDVPSLRFLVDLGVPAIKLASASIVDEELLPACAATGLPIIASTGGATLQEIEDARLMMRTPDMAARGVLAKNLAILSCVATYPTEPRDMNLSVIESLRDEFPNTVIGLSDHYSGIALTAASYLLGARIIEKHFTLHRAWKGADQAFSLEPSGMSRLVRDLQRMRVAMGSGVKQRLDEEVPALIKMGRKDLLNHIPSALLRGW